MPAPPRPPPIPTCHRPSEASSQTTCILSLTRDTRPETTRSWDAYTFVGCGEAARGMRGSTRRGCLKPTKVWPEEHEKSTKNRLVYLCLARFDARPVPREPGCSAFFPTRSTARLLSAAAVTTAADPAPE